MYGAMAAPLIKIWLNKPQARPLSAEPEGEREQG